MTERTSERASERALTEARTLAAQNDQLHRLLREARDTLADVRAHLESLTNPPLTSGIVTGLADDGVDVVIGSRHLRVATTPDCEQLAVGDGVLLNDALVIAARVGAPLTGSLAVVVQPPEGEFVVVRGSADAEQRLRLVGELVGLTLGAGDSLLVDIPAGLALDLVARKQVQELVLEEVPDVTYDDIGGLGRQIEAIRDAVELPFRHRDAYLRYHLRPPKGVLLYGPPGCGKTMIAKAVANSLGPEGSHFLNVKGPELLDKYVGETERQIRAIFARARALAADGRPVIVFFDEMDSLFRTRGSGVSSDMENTIVPQLLSEIDGVESLSNVIVIGASNREDMIDPAILRPGRLDVKIKLDRPDEAGAWEIVAKYLTSDVPLADGVRVQELVAEAVRQIYARTDENRFLEVTYASGDREVLWFSDFASGAMINNIVDRAKKLAIKDELAGGPGGVSLAGIRQACRDEFAENEDLPSTTNPDDWASVQGRKGERIVFIRTLVRPTAVPAPSDDPA